VACHLIAEVDSVLPADPVAPSSTGHRSYRRRSRRVFRRVAGFAQLGEQRADPAGDALMAAGLAVPAALPGIGGKLALQAQALAEPHRVVRGSDELGAGQVEIALARAFPGQAQAVAEFQFGLAEAGRRAGCRRTAPR